VLANGGFAALPISSRRQRWARKRGHWSALFSGGLAHSVSRAYSAHRGTALLVAKRNPKAWKTPHRFLFIRTRGKHQHKDPVQLDLFVPHAYGYEFKVILTNEGFGCPQDAHELQMIGHPTSRPTAGETAGLLGLRTPGPFRRRIIQRGRPLDSTSGTAHPQYGANPAVEEKLLHYLDALQAA
jgi:hypothetical protein